MAGVRKALIVATDEYSDPKLTRLNAPARDARVLADVLRDEAVGAFEVETVFNRPTHEVELAIAEFFGAGKFGDTLLAHFSSHGVKSPSGELYFATTNTDLSDTFRLKVTGVPSALVRDAMEESRASLILCLVDCCYSGAFVKLAKAADTVDLTERLGGKGRAVITASTSLQLALDGKEEPSLFTHAVIDGLRSGEADRDLDGLVSLDELYSFVHERVTSRNPNQTPVKSFDVQGDVYVARRSTPVDKPAPLEPELLADVRALVPYKRLGAVQGLAAVLVEPHPGRSLAARLELGRLASEDDSLKVRAAAQQVLDGAGDLPTPLIPQYEPAVATRGGPAVDDPPTIESDTGTDTGTGTETDTDIESDTDTDTGTDTETERETGAETGTDDGGGGTTSWWHSAGAKRAGLVALGLVGMLAIGGVAWQVLSDGDAGGGGGGNPGGTTSSSVEASGPVLPATEILLTINDLDQNKGIFALDIESSEVRRKVVGDPLAKLPTISEDRRWMVYLRSDPPGFVPHLARVDGSEDAPLLDAETSETCPFTLKPAFSPDGERLAAICRDANKATVGLVIVDRDGRLVRLLSGQDFDGAPTWTGDGRIIVMRKVGGDDTTTLWAISPDGKELERLTDGSRGSDSHPDWSDQGLVFVRDQGGSSGLYHMENLVADSEIAIPTIDRADAPAWAPGGEPALVWLERAPQSDEKTLWYAALGDESPRNLGTGVYGAPAWGSR